MILNQLLGQQVSTALCCLCLGILELYVICDLSGICVAWFIPVDDLVDSFGKLKIEKYSLWKPVWVLT